MPSPLVNNEALFRMSGMWGEARDLSGRLLAEVTAVSATAEIGQIDVPLVGTNRSGYKPGRVTRSGSFSIQKIDAHWELEVYRLVSADVESRRAMRGTADSILKRLGIVVADDQRERRSGSSTVACSGACRSASPSGTTFAIWSSRSPTNLSSR